MSRSQWEGGPSTTVLYADEDAAAREFATLALSHAGYEVDVVEDGERAWIALHAKPYDLLVTEFQMRRLSGLELIRKLRLSRMSVPVIVASGQLGALPLEDLPWLDCRAMLAKPFTEEQLIVIVREVLRAAMSVPTPSEVRLPALTGFHAEIRPTRGWGIND